MVGMISKKIMQGMGCKMSTLLQQAQEIFKLNAKWNRAIGLIKEISIKHYEQDEFNGFSRQLSTFIQDLTSKIETSGGEPCFLETVQQIEARKSGSDDKSVNVRLCDGRSGHASIPMILRRPDYTVKYYSTML